jgi:hypothetical protein
LLAAAEVVSEVRILLQGLPDSGDVAVSEDPETAGKELLLPAISFHILLLQKLHDGLRRC